MFLVTARYGRGLASVARRGPKPSDLYKNEIKFIIKIKSLIKTLRFILEMKKIKYH